MKPLRLAPMPPPGCSAGTNSTCAAEQFFGEIAPAAMLCRQCARAAQQSGETRLQLASSSSVFCQSWRHARSTSIQRSQMSDPLAGCAMRAWLGSLVAPRMGLHAWHSVGNSSATRLHASNGSTEPPMGDWSQRMRALHVLHALHSVGNSSATRLHALNGSTEPPMGDWSQRMRALHV